MADSFTVLSAAATIQQLLVAAGKIIQYCYGYSQKYRHAGTKAGQLSQELRGLVCILTEINLVILQRRDRTRPLHHLGPLIDEAKVDLLQMLGELPQGKPGAKDRIAWPFTEDKTTEVINAVSKKLAALHLAIGLENLHINEKSWGHVEALQRSFAAWTVKLDHATQDRYQTRSETLRWISFNHLPSLRFRQQHEDKRAIRHPTAGISTLTHDLFLKWKSRQFYGQDSWLWAIGEAGSRKSIVMSVVVDDLLTSSLSNDIQVAVLYCQYELTDPVVEQTLAHILGSLTAQLLRGIFVLPYRLVAAYTEQGDQGEPPLSLMTDIFISAVQALGSCYLVVDGLDELSSPVQTSLLNVLDRLGQERVKILISSRPHPFDLKTRLEHADVITIAPDQGEITSYLTDEIANNDKLQVKIEHDSQTAEYLVKEISSKAGHSFTFAVAMLGTIQAGISKAQVIKLAESSKTPSDVFDSTMKRILQRPEKDDAIVILGWLAYTRSPLTLEQLRVAMAVTPHGGFDKDAIPAQDIMLEICSGLIEVEPSSGVVRLIHLTARDFLINQPELNSKAVEKRLAQTCIQYLMDPAFGKICATHDELRRRQTENCFTTYAASYWAIHAHAAQEAGLTESILTFALQPYASSALQLMPIDFSESFAGPASPIDYRLGLCQELIPVSYLCAQFRLAKSQRTLSELEPNLIGQPVTWGHRYSPLHLAVWLNDNETAKILLQCKTNIAHQDRFGLTPAHLAASLSSQASHAHNDILNLILQADQEEHTVRDVADQDGRTALHLAAKAGTASAMKLLLEKGYKANIKDHRGCTPFHTYIHFAGPETTVEKSSEILSLMLKHGANPTLANDQGRSPLSMAMANDWMDHVAAFREALDPSTGRPYDFSPHDVKLSDPIYQQVLLERAADQAMFEERQLAAQRQDQLNNALKKLLRVNNKPSDQETSHV